MMPYRSSTAAKTQPNLFHFCCCFFFFYFLAKELNVLEANTTAIAIPFSWIWSFELCGHIFFVKNTRTGLIRVQPPNFVYLRDERSRLCVFVGVITTILQFYIIYLFCSAVQCAYLRIKHSIICGRRDQLSSSAVCLSSSLICCLLLLLLLWFLSMWIIYFVNNTR